MDIKQEKIQFLGLNGVFKESYKIIHSSRKILGQVILTLILPLSFIFLIHIEVFDVLFTKILHDSEERTKTQHGTPQYEKLIHMISSEWDTFLLFNLVYFIFILILLLLSTTAVVNTIASIYTAREVTFNKVMSVVPKVWKRLLVTFLCIVFAFIIYNVMAVLVIWPLAIGVPKGGIAIFVVLTILYLAGFVYLNVVWQLASVVTVLEESYGFDAMAKSKELVKGKMGLFIFNFLIELLFMVVVVRGWKMFTLGSMGKTAYGILCLLLLSHLILVELVLQTVLYFVCKSYHQENIDTSALSDHLKVYLVEYKTLEAVKYHSSHLMGI